MGGLHYGRVAVVFLRAEGCGFPPTPKASWFVAASQLAQRHQEELTHWDGMGIVSVQYFTNSILIVFITCFNFFIVIIYNQ